MYYCTHTFLLLHLKLDSYALTIGQVIFKLYYKMDKGRKLRFFKEKLHPNPTKIWCVVELNAKLL